MAFGGKDDSGQCVDGVEVFDVASRRWIEYPVRDQSTVLCCAVLTLLCRAEPAVWIAQVDGAGRGRPLLVRVWRAGQRGQYDRQRMLVHGFASVLISLLQCASTASPRPGPSCPSFHSHDTPQQYAPNTCTHTHRPTPIVNTQAGHLEGLVIVTGGENDKGVHRVVEFVRLFQRVIGEHVRTVEAFDPVRGQWRKLADLWFARVHPPCL